MSEYDYEQIKSRVIEEARVMHKMNRKNPTIGQRYDLPVKNRTLNVVYHRTEQENAPLFIGFHGGGYLFGGNALNEKMWSAVSSELNVNVASVAYRLSPDYQYREALADAFDASLYLRDHAGQFGFDQERISVIGFSAGANLAATLCLYMKRKDISFFDHQILIYPFLDLFTDPGKKGDKGKDDVVTCIFNELHCMPEEAKQSIVSPVFAAEDELKGLPAAIIDVAGSDYLKEEGVRYAEMLKEAGVPVAMMESKNMPHGFFENTFGDMPEEAMNFFSADEKKLLKDGSMRREADVVLQFIKENM